MRSKKLPNATNTPHYDSQYPWYKIIFYVFENRAETSSTFALTEISEHVIKTYIHLFKVFFCLNRGSNLLITTLCVSLNLHFRYRIFKVQKRDYTFKL